MITSTSTQPATAVVVLLSQRERNKSLQCIEIVFERGNARLDIKSQGVVACHLSCEVISRGAKYRLSSKLLAVS
jgi:hypothetical protein